MKLNMQKINSGDILLCPSCGSEEYEVLAPICDGVRLDAELFRHLRGVEISKGELFECKKCFRTMNDGNNYLVVKK
jgi:hypothetical protein